MAKAQKISILIVDRMHEFLMDELDRNGISYDYRPEIKEEAVLEILPQHRGLVIRGKLPIDERILPGAQNLELIVRAGSGMDNIDVDLMTKNGIQCYHCAGGNSDAVGEQTIGMLLALCSNITKSNQETLNLKWDREGNRGFELRGKTVGIIGYGHTGSAVAEKLRGFACRVMAFDKYKQGFGNDWVEEVTLDKLYSEADVISFHIPLTKETKHWINDDFFEALSKPVVLLNLARGGIMNTEAIINTLRGGGIRALGLDVLENEKIESWTKEEKEQFEQLRSFENVIVTPHVGGWTSESYRRISEMCATKILAHFEKSIPFVKDEDNISDNT